jgi:hypothetical protein
VPEFGPLSVEGVLLRVSLRGQSQISWGGGGGNRIKSDLQYTLIFEGCMV